MELKSFLLPEKVVSFPFPDCEGFEVDLTYLSKESTQAIYKKCEKPKYDMRLRETTKEFDDDLFLKIYVGSVVKGWKGFKMKFLNKLVLAEVPADQEENEIPYSQENALDLMKSSNIFDTWVADMISNLGNFSKSNTKKNVSE